LDLGLFQSDVGEQIGVDTTTVHNWERNASVPAIRYVPAIVGFLGYGVGFNFAIRAAILNAALGATALTMPSSKTRDTAAGQKKFQNSCTALTSPEKFIRSPNKRSQNDR
jgi:DNA-binding XRE family transcriptional regulator